jgi:hypothetical protein
VIRERLARMMESVQVVESKEPSEGDPFVLHTDTPLTTTIATKGALIRVVIKTDENMKKIR